MAMPVDQYEETTAGIRVCVIPQYLDDQSDPRDNHFVWAYEITITNEGKDTVQLRDRYWHITDATGHVEEVAGPGVVGEQPVLNPGDTFSYTSGCPLPTPSGIMRGHYTMADERGGSFNVSIPPFSLDLPGARTIVN